MAFYPSATANLFTPVNLSAHRAGTSRLVLKQIPAENTREATALALAHNVPDVGGVCLEQSNTIDVDQHLIVGYKSTTIEADINWSHYTYSTSASQTTGVGVSLDGANTGFSIDGTTTNSSGYTANFPVIDGESSNYMEAESTWDDTYYLCPNGEGGFAKQWDFTFNSVSSVYGTPGAPIVAAGHCVQQAPNVDDTYTTDQQTTWSSGANVSPIIGINLSSQDGWSGSSSLTYNLKRQAAVCGVSAPPNYQGSPSPGYIQVH
jgi:hypothetical protein